MRWAAHVAHMSAKRNTDKILVGKLEGGRPLGKPGSRSEANIKMYIRVIGWDDTNWIDLAQDRD
jgi:hypothetical protein